MKTPEELKRFYDERLAPQLKPLEARRKKIMVGVILVDIIGVALMALPILAFAVQAMFDIGNPLVCCCIGAVPFFAGVIVIGVGNSKLTKQYVKDYKENIVKQIVKLVDEGLEYEPKKMIAESVFRRSGIFTQTPDRYGGEDYVSGTIGKTKVEFSEVHAEYKTEHTDSKGHHHTEWHTIFRGLFIIADFNKNFKGKTIVLPDTAEKLFGGLIGGLLQSANVFRGKVIKLEDPEFEKLFVVYGDDQVEARYILSPSLMARLVEYRKKTKRNIYFSFVENNVVVALPFGKDLFEPRVFRTIMDFKQVQEYFDAIQLATDIVDDLNLNTRIWSKE